MTKQVRLELDGDLAESGFRVTLEIRDDWSPHAITLQRSLPASATLATLLENHWRHRYRTLGAPSRIKTKRVIHKGTFSRRWEECKLSAGQLQESFNQWLQSESFQPLYKRLQQELHPREEIHFLIRSNNPLVHKLPWSAWELFEDYPRAEPALSPVDFEPVAIAPPLLTDRVNVLVILGHSEGINVTKDMEIIQQLPHVRPTFLIEPKRTEISEELWRQPWDIIFFAGHSVTEDEQGVIYINPDESITVDDLWLGLRQAVRRGLQLAIFNSCDGLGLARRLNDLNIPQMVVMRELVPDRVAQQFLSYFLPAFAAGESLYQAVRSARERLDEMEEQFPCASWLPVLCQNPTSIPPRWQDLYRLADELEDYQPIPPPIPPKPPLLGQKGWKRLAIISLVVTLLVMGIRWLGFFEVAELRAFDQLMRLRPQEQLDHNILIIEATPDDNKEYGYPLSDKILAEVLKKIKASQPLYIGLNMHRGIPQKSATCKANKNCPAERAELITELAESEDLVTICSSIDGLGEAYQPPEGLTDRQIGFSRLTLDRDDTIRRQLISYNPNYLPHITKCTAPNSFSFHLAHRFLTELDEERIYDLYRSSRKSFDIEAFSKRLHRLNDVNITQNQEWRFGDSVISRLARNAGGYTKVDGKTNEIVINYRATRQPATTVSIRELLNDGLPSDSIRDRIVILGTNNHDENPFINTPYGDMPSVWIHAHVVSNLINYAIGERPFIWFMPKGLEVLALFCVSSLFGLVAVGSRKRLLILGYFLLTFGLLCLVSYASLLSLGIWIPLIPAILAVFIVGCIISCVKR